MRVSSSLVAFALYLGLAAAMAIPPPPPPPKGGFAGSVSKDFAGIVGRDNGGGSTQVGNAGGSTGTGNGGGSTQVGNAGGGQGVGSGSGAGIGRH